MKSRLWLMLMAAGYAATAFAVGAGAPWTYPPAEPLRAATVAITAAAAFAAAALAIKPTRTAWYAASALLAAGAGSQTAGALFATHAGPTRIAAAIVWLMLGVTIASRWAQLIPITWSHRDELAAARSRRQFDPPRTTSHLRYLPHQESRQNDQPVHRSPRTRARLLADPRPGRQTSRADG